MQIDKQRHLLEILLSSKDVFSKCIPILKPEYFDGELRNAVGFVVDYFDKYSTPPDLSTLKAEIDISLESQAVTPDKFEYACSEIEDFCRGSAVAQAMMQSMDELTNKEYGAIVERMKDAINISLKRDLGISFYSKDFETHLKHALESQKTITTGIRGLDVLLDGGFVRKQVSIFSANSAGGKSIMLNNLAYNYSAMGYHVVLLSLELPKEMILTRSTAITTGHSIKTLRDTFFSTVEAFDDIRDNIDGSLYIDRLRGDASCNDIISYLTHYELELERRPDVVIVDYLDKMTPNQGIRNMNISDQDKHKSEQLAELAYNYDVIALTASQQNRGAVGNSDVQQDSMAGGLTKTQTVDNVISLYMDDVSRIQGQLYAKALKTRSADGTGKKVTLHFNTANLRITDSDSKTNNGLFDISKKIDEYEDKLGLPGVQIIYDGEEIEEPSPKNNKTRSSELLDYMESIQEEL